MHHLETDPGAAEASIDAVFVVRRLEEAGAALLAMPNTGWTTKLRTSNLDIVRLAADSYAPTDKRIRPPVPSAAEITRMDEAMGWILLIPVDRYVLRRIVGARSLVNPVTERHLFPWRRLGAAMGADHKAVQRWHAEGIARIVAALTVAENRVDASARQPSRPLVRAPGDAMAVPATQRGRPRVREGQPA
ncbi:MAG: DUF6362 family protein [Acetobacteraceae bacterium]